MGQESMVPGPKSSLNQSALDDVTNLSTSDSQCHFGLRNFPNVFHKVLIPILEVICITTCGWIISNKIQFEE